MRKLLQRNAVRTVGLIASFAWCCPSPPRLVAALV